MTEIPAKEMVPGEVYLMKGTNGSGDTYTALIKCSKVGTHSIDFINISDDDPDETSKWKPGQERTIMFTNSYKIYKL